MAWLPDGDKNFDDMFIRFDTTHERDRQAHRQTPDDGIGRGKNSICKQKAVRIEQFIAINLLCCSVYGSV